MQGDFRSELGTDVTLASMLCRSYKIYSDKTALLSPNQDYSYESLGVEVDRIVAGLRELGIERGDVVLMLVSNRPEFFFVEQALVIGGFVRYSLSTRLHLKEVEYVASDSSAKAIIADVDWANLLSTNSHKFPSVRHVISVDRANASSGALDLETLPAPQASHADVRLPLPSEDCAIIYTSGTTGLPKGVVHTHRSWTAMARNSMLEIPRIDPSDVLLHVAPLSHMSGYFAGPYFLKGASHLAMPNFSPSEVLRAIERHGVTTIPLVPTMLNALIMEIEVNASDTSSLRTILYGASTIAPDRLRRAIEVFGEVFVQFYGQSETGMPLSALSIADHRFDPELAPPARLGSAGRVASFVELKIVREDGGVSDAGEVGEIVARTDSMMRGYRGRPEETREAIDTDGWASTEDLGYLDSEGYLTIVDRKRDMIISGGYNIYPNEVENAIMVLEGVAEVAVVGIPDPHWGEAVKAFVAIRDGYSVSIDDVLGVCSENIAGYKKPKHVEFLEELPKTSTGKILRRALRTESGDEREK